jgi:acyl-CoA synthetase (AMP-forming)/AMP-acid ligase II
VVYDAYGQSETWGGCVANGVPIPGARVRLGTADEIELAGPMVMRDYRRDPEASRTAFTTDGWLRSGDVGRFADDGRLEVVDRLRDLVITGGVNVSPVEVEQVLAEHPAIADVAVVGAPDDEWGERVVAHVVPRDASAPPTLYVPSLGNGSLRRSCRASWCSSPRSPAAAAARSSAARCAPEPEAPSRSSAPSPCGRGRREARVPASR